MVVYQVGERVYPDRSQALKEAKTEDEVKALLLTGRTYMTVIFSEDNEILAIAPPGQEEELCWELVMKYDFGPIRVESIWMKF